MAAKKGYLVVASVVALSLVIVYLLVAGFKLSAINKNDTKNAVRSSSLEDLQEVVGVNFAGPRHRRYVLACSLWEKTTMAVANMFSLLRFTHEWKAVVPVPFLNEHSLGGFPNYTAASNDRLSLKSLFKLDDFQSSPPRYPGLAQLVDYDHFLGEMRNILHHTFYIRINHGRKRHRSRHIRKMHCSNSIFSKYIPNNIRASSIKVTCCLVPSFIPTLPSNISKGCGFDGLDEFLVVFEEWRGIAVPAARKKYRLLVPSSFVANYTFPIPSSLQQSDHVVECADKFVKEFVGEGVQFIGVHLRTEKLKIHSHSGLLNDINCLQKTFETVKEIERNTNIKHTLYFADLFWRYDHSKIFEAYKVKVTKFIPKQFDCLQHEAFVAQVEQNIVSRAARLVVCGGGSFQMAIVDRYNRLNSSRMLPNSFYFSPQIISGCGFYLDR